MMYNHHIHQGFPAFWQLKMFVQITCTEIESILFPQQCSGSNLLCMVISVALIHFKNNLE